MNQMEETLTLDLDELEDRRGDEEFPWTMFLVDNVAYGLSSRHVLSIEILGQVTPIVGDPPYCRGVSHFRDDMIPLVDLRILFGKGNRVQELESMMRARIQDHVHYVNTLTECVNTMTHFVLTADPHACAFGKWFYSFRTNNNALSSLLKRIESPHSKIHQMAGEVNECIARGDKANAEQKLKLIKEDYFVNTVSLLEQVVSAYVTDNREMVVVLDINGRAKGFIVDEIISVEFIDHFVESHGAQEKSKYIEKIAQRQKNSENVLLINVEELFNL